MMRMILFVGLAVAAFGVDHAFATYVGEGETAPINLERQWFEAEISDISFEEDKVHVDLNWKTLFPTDRQSITAVVELDPGLGTEIDSISIDGRRTELTVANAEHISIRRFSFSTKMGEEHEIGIEFSTLEAPHRSVQALLVAWLPQFNKEITIYSKNLDVLAPEELDMDTVVRCTLPDGTVYVTYGSCENNSTLNSPQVPTPRALHPDQNEDLTEEQLDILREALENHTDESSLRLSGTDQSHWNRSDESPAIVGCASIDGKPYSWLLSCVLLLGLVWSRKNSLAVDIVGRGCRHSKATWAVCFCTFTFMGATSTATAADRLHYGYLSFWDTRPKYDFASSRYPECDSGDLDCLPQNANCCFTGVDHVSVTVLGYVSGNLTIVEEFQLDDDNGFFWFLADEDVVPEYLWVILEDTRSGQPKVLTEAGGNSTPIFHLIPTTVSGPDPDPTVPLYYGLISVNQPGDTTSIVGDQFALWETVQDTFNYVSNPSYGNTSGILTGNELDINYDRSGSYANASGEDEINIGGSHVARGTSPAHEVGHIAQARATTGGFSQGSKVVDSLTPGMM